MIRQVPKLLLNGFRLGMVLQVGGMGPISFLLFQLPSFVPVVHVLIGVWAVTLADAVYIYLSVFGLSALVRKVKDHEIAFKRFVGLLLILIGAMFVRMVFSKGGSEAINQTEWLQNNLFWGLFGLTIVNPVTIVCFTGIFSAEIAEHKLSLKQLSVFAFGTLMSTPVFLSFVVVVGAAGHAYFPAVVIKGLNVLVGLLLIGWGIKNILPKPETAGKAIGSANEK